MRNIAGERCALACESRQPTALALGEPDHGHQTGWIGGDK